MQILFLNEFLKLVFMTLHSLVLFESRQIPEKAQPSDISGQMSGISVSHTELMKLQAVD